MEVPRHLRRMARSNRESGQGRNCGWQKHMDVLRRRRRRALFESGLPAGKRTAPGVERGSGTFKFWWNRILTVALSALFNQNRGLRVQYFQTNFQTLTEISKLCGFDGLAGYLVLARHATGRTILNFPHHSLSGAGVNSIHEKLGCSEVRAKAILETLIQNGFVEHAPPEAKAAAPKSARWFLPKQQPFDTDIPHNLVDSPELNSQLAVSSPLKRLKKLPPLPGQDRSSANCDGAMLLLTMYASNQMRKFGGLPITSAIYRSWNALSITPSPSGNNFEWKAVHGEKRAYKDFIKRSLPHVSDDEEDRAKRFWNAFENLQNVGLIYEVVSLFDGADKKELLVSLRVNDFHAGSINRSVSGDPSLLGTLESNFNTRFAFYEQEEDEFRVTLPYPSGAIYGVYRLRFRAANADTGHWFEEETERVEHVLEMILSEVSDADYDDDF